MLKQNKHKRSKGVAIELAIITLLEIFGLCLVLLTLLEFAIIQNNKANDEVIKRTELSLIGDAFVRNCKNGRFNDFDTDSYKDDYAVTKINDQNEYVLIVRNKDNVTVLLYVVCDKDGNIKRFTNNSSDFGFVTTVPESDPVVTSYMEYPDQATSSIAEETDPVIEQDD